ncbi:hypothetical protein [Deinococcus ruber]|uniref:Uncharacterized protein n=1 Tax=Deinococcus ruber TaxID=1848197 RepID=A0A918FDQ5_9DEIO|nr:hypothetical protein [Deinococcus ruber]GGR33793.1 hypothetical protein GCM10008957_49970 [Deinococcus ruber]
MYVRIQPTTPGFFTVEDMPGGMTDLVEARRIRFGWQARLHEDGWASPWVYGISHRQATLCLLHLLNTDIGEKCTYIFPNWFTAMTKVSSAPAGAPLPTVRSSDVLEDDDLPF